MSEGHRCVVGNEQLDERKDAPDAIVCFRCSNRILRHLRELEEYLPTLSLLRSPGGMESIGRAGFGPRSPANDAVLAHIDPRSEVAAFDEDGKAWLACECYVGDPRCNHQRDLGAVSVIGSWARLVSEDLEVNVETHWMQQVELLRRNHSWIVQQLWVDEYAAQLKQVHAAVRALAHDPVPRSQGKCIRFEGNVECRGDVYEMDDASGVRCSKNRSHVYTGLDLDRLRVAQEAS